MSLGRWLLLRQVGDRIVVIHVAIATTAALTENQYQQAITPLTVGDTSVPIDAVIAWFDSVKKLNNIRRRTMAFVPSVERPLVAGDARTPRLRLIADQGAND